MAFTKPATAISALVCLALSATAYADTSDIKTSNNQLGFQFISTNVDYTETYNGITLDTETGGVPGNAISISLMKDLWFGNDYIEAEYDYSSGNTKYVGGYIGPPATPYGSVTGTSGATLTDYSARYGIGQIINYTDDESADDLMLTYFAELGHHEWDRGVNLGETYTHNHFGIGVLCQYSPASRLVLSANAMIGITFGSNIDVVGFFSGALGNSTLYRAGVSADYAFVQNLHGNVGVEYTSFDYGISAVYGGYLEPDSTTNYTTVRVGLGYAF